MRHCQPARTPGWALAVQTSAVCPTSMGRVGYAAFLAAARGAPSMKGPIMETSAASPADLFPAELVHLLSTARRVIDQHWDNYGSCAECRSSWPCQHARLADFALAAL